MSSYTPSNNAEISAASDQLASLEVTDDQTNAKSSDTSAEGAAPPSEAPSEEGGRVLDPELWKPHSPNEECPVCFVPLPFNESDSCYWVCCGKTICTGFMAETVVPTQLSTKRGPKRSCRRLVKLVHFVERTRMNLYLNMKSESAREMAAPLVA